VLYVSSNSDLAGSLPGLPAGNNLEEKIKFWETKVEDLHQNNFLSLVICRANNILQQRIISEPKETATVLQLPIKISS
jgi:hypothetical protein